MSANHKNPTKVVTGVVRLSYANVWEPASINGSNPKYSVSLIIPKTDTKTIDAINAAVDAAIKDGAAKFGGKIPNKAALKLPLRDGDLERRLLRQRQQHHRAPDCGPLRAAHPGPRRGLLRLLRPCVRQLLRLQLQRQSRHRLRSGQHPEGAGR